MPTAAAFFLPITKIGELPADQYVGLIDETAVECLKVRLAAEGLLTPIWVRKNGNAAKPSPYSVIAGRHRRRAAIALGWTDILVEVRAGADSDPDQLRRLQLAENLDRRVLRPIERALSIMVRWQEQGGLTELDTVSNAEKDKRTADICGIDSDRTIRRYRRIFDELVTPFPDHFALINAHPLGKSMRAMTELAKKPKDLRGKAIDTLLSNPDWKSIGEVFLAAGIEQSPGLRADPRRDEAGVVYRFEKLAAKRKVAALKRMAKKVPPAVVRELIDELSEMLP